MAADDESRHPVSEHHLECVCDKFCVLITLFFFLEKNFNFKWLKRKRKLKKHFFFKHIDWHQVTCKISDSHNWEVRENTKILITQINPHWIDFCVYVCDDASYFKIITGRRKRKKKLVIKIVMLKPILTRNFQSDKTLKIKKKKFKRILLSSFTCTSLPLEIEACQNNYYQ